MINEIILKFIIALIVAVLAFFARQLWKLIKYQVYGRFKKHPLQRDWHTYHFTNENKKIIMRYEKWNIKKNVIGDLAVETDDPNRPGLIYKGKISSVNDYFWFYFEGLGHNERFQIRFDNPIPSKNQRMYGFFLGVDFNNSPYSTIWLASRDKISNLVASKLLHKYSKNDNKDLSLRINKNAN
jgi:hypothetical protein